MRRRNKSESKEGETMTVVDHDCSSSEVTYFHPYNFTLRTLRDTAAERGRRYWYRYLPAPPQQHCAALLLPRRSDHHLVYHEPAASQSHNEHVAMCIQRVIAKRCGKVWIPCLCIDLRLLGRGLIHSLVLEIEAMSYQIVSPSPPRH